MKKSKYFLVIYMDIDLSCEYFIFEIGKGCTRKDAIIITEDVNVLKIKLDLMGLKWCYNKAIEDLTPHEIMINSFNLYEPLDSYC